MSKVDDARYELIEGRQDLSDVEYVRQLDTMEVEAGKTGLIGGICIGVLMTILTMEMLEDFVELIIRLFQ